jgi:glycosidase
VAAQQTDPDSVLHFVRAVVALRRQSPDLLTGGYQSQVCPDRSWVWRRGTGTIVALNFGDDPAAIPLSARRHEITLTTERGGETTAVHGTVTLAPWQGIVLLERA